MASAACKKTALDPVEFRVATHFCPMIALLPIPVMTNFPRQPNNADTTCAKWSFIEFCKSCKTAISMLKVLIATSIISVDLFTFFDYLRALLKKIW